MLMPFVTVIMPVRNEEAYLAGCLDSLFATDYGLERLEVLVIDGSSTDRTLEILAGYQTRYPCLRLLENPRQLQVAALNLGIQAARGEIIVRMDAHSEYPADYIGRCVTLLLASGADNVGGVLEAAGRTPFGKAVALAVTSPFGAGDAKYRTAVQEAWVDTIFPGVWRKTTLQRLGGFQAAWEVNEDYELNYRLRRSGGKILLSPAIRCRYYVREGIGALARQYFRYGHWKVKTLVAHPDSLRWRQLAAPLLVLGLAVSALTAWWLPVLGALPPALYLLAALAASAAKGLRWLPVLPVVYLTLHLSWGIGFFSGIFKWGLPRLTLQHVRNAVRAIRS
ncbi:cellulose synthase/poly-beta-1,6-N-acetylglucosamine synthase-like glycosyltransferase [Tumebacillus sp. BK434]|uniref:glycosyltransferase family 2 protein n=1 Tax=Tumebacillus sp. BK434 TaxID=2512169 RepID=UPI0010D3FC78|nr:glycosyltransferase family 2 protein [Tumebacillus sp. BK434]TCP58977.1 cellulose synthase/poly-beta-1,6-N-acetylglucosamine synthase-like glycosyltransferase [Tumebacillus sp. BK434]